MGPCRFGNKNRCHVALSRSPSEINYDLRRVDSCCWSKARICKQNGIMTNYDPTRCLEPALFPKTSTSKTCHIRGWANAWFSLYSTAQAICTKPLRHLARLQRSSICRSMRPAGKRSLRLRFHQGKECRRSPSCLLAVCKICLVARSRARHPHSGHSQ
jgi:hypothetical protein